MAKRALGLKVDLNKHVIMKQGEAIQEQAKEKIKNPNLSEKVQVGIKRKISWKSSKLLNNEINYDIEKNTE